MQNKLYVGNLNFQASEGEITDFFSKFGSVMSVNLIKDQFTGRSKGFAFVEMGSPQEAEKAIEANGTELQGRSLTISEARPRNNDRGGSREGRSSGGGNKFNNRSRY